MRYLRVTSPSLRAATGLFAAAMLTGVPGRAESAAPLLLCEVTYAGTTHIVQARPQMDPYRVASVDIAGRFRFKAVMVGEAQRLDYIKLYAYLETPNQPVLIQQASYLPPFQIQATPYALTGEQRLYAGSAERELHYRCTLEGLSP